MNEDKIDLLIDFVIKDAFEGLSDTDPYSVEKSIRAWFNLYQPERSKREDCNCPDRYLLNGTYMGKYCRCGALNSMET